MVKHDKNLSQFIPSAPMAQQESFKTHDHTSYPFKKTADYPKFYKVILRSDDKISGTNDNAVYNITLPNEFKDYAVCVPESFYIKGSGNALATTPYSVHVRELMNPNSYQSQNGLATDVILTTIGYSYKNNAQVGSAGIPILNASFFNSRTVNVYFSAMDDISSVVDDYILTIVFYQS